MKYILHSSNIGDTESIGGKARNLHLLEKTGPNIPDWAVIPQTILLDQIPEEADEEQLKEHFSELKVPKGLIEELAEYFGPDHQEKFYAVRSSAVDEDDVDFSFAGQFESFLYIGFENLAEKIKAVWRSAISDRVINYRKNNDLPLQFGIAVIVQEMVDSEVSGVGFGMDPNSGNKDRKIISSLYGLGEGVVSGDLNADTFIVTPNGIEQKLANKQFKYVQAPNEEGIKKVEVQKEQQHEASLQKEEVEEVAALLDRLTEEFGEPQDIEFAYVNGELFLLQTRPITTAKKEEKKGEYIIWDNSNIVESYPGVTTPLTFSFIVKMYEHVYRQFLSLMGVPEKQIEKNKDVFANTLGLVRGRVYYNLLNWYKMLAMLPGYSLNAQFMENMMGVKESFELEEDYQMAKSMAWYRLFLMMVKMVTLNFTLPRKRRNFKEHLDKVMSEYKDLNFNSLQPDEIIDRYERFQDTLLLKWKAPLINDFFAMIWFGLLEKQCAKHCPDETNLHNDLLCGSKDIVSVEPMHRTIEIVQQIRNKEEVLSFFKDHDPKQIWKALEEGKFPEIKSSIDKYLDAYGERCVGELKLETVSYAQKPSKYIGLLSSYIEKEVDLKKNPEIDQEIRAKAEVKIYSALKGKPLQKWWFDIVLRKAREVVSSRENLRYERTRGFGMVRKMFHTLGQKLKSSGDLEDERDIFYLKLNEILGLKNSPLDEKLLSKIKDRKERFEEYREQPPPKERFYTYGKNFSDEYIYSDEKMESIEGDLKGTGCCPGKVKGKVRIVKDPDSIDSVDNDILVTSSTDPGWVKLFPTAAAIIVERGSLLSHSAIVSREMGIPCIVGVTGLLRTLESGDEIEMDGSTGVIKVLSQ